MCRNGFSPIYIKHNNQFFYVWLRVLLIILNDNIFIYIHYYYSIKDEMIKTTRPETREEEEEETKKHLLASKYIIGTHITTTMCVRVKTVILEKNLKILKFERERWLELENTKRCLEERRK
jgi:hypothetical protein